jgi:hypothetical protein
VSRADVALPASLTFAAHPAPTRFPHCRPCARLRPVAVTNPKPVPHRMLGVRTRRWPRRRPEGPAGAAGQPARPIRRKLQARRDTHSPRRSQAMDLNASFIQPMRDELTRVGFTELRTPDDVDTALGQAGGTTLVFVNSVCGCAAGMARPGAALALSRTGARPDRLVTVFAGQDREATERARIFRRAAVVAVHRVAQGRRARRLRAAAPDRGPRARGRGRPARARLRGALRPGLASVEASCRTQRTPI